MAAAMSKIDTAHQMYREGRHEQALGLYTEALAMAKSKAQKIALHSNRAACYLKLHEFKKAAEECTSVLELDHQHTGALMLRAQTLVTLKDYQSALFDVNQLMELNPSSEVYQNLQARLKTQLSLAPIPESEEEALYHENDEEDDQQKQWRSHSGDNGKVKLAQKFSEVPVIQPAKVHASSSVSPKPEGQPTQWRTHSGENGRDKPAKLQASASVSPKPQGWEAIPKPKGHSGLDYSRWDRVKDESSEEDEDDDTEEQQPQYRFRVRTVGARPVK
ncbi:protein unc-45 homolog A-like [Zingiber officinale]|uniref:Uncharacterized protein n=1 Tax=Zingiber officinale TaxID=94328 RepID=A0A8J5EQ77_ZINOF|nr:protein unc-45 homolog A-like [Zingiber officinale]XP_042445369.1 protein unc-45 homolog A-like [Zingiber officinale]KAG6472370.1 hypothetical protein ZIOFF_069830 [Zingiber officinale]KAG6474174.1 hypothetical protein ZIOFF_068098 [Zingiber officinale]